MRFPSPPILFDARQGARPTRSRLETAPEKPIRVVAVDDHFAVRAALIDTIEAHDDMVLAGVAGTAEEARELVEKERPDVAVVDINLGEVSGIDLIEELRGKQRSLKVIVFSIFDESVYAERARQAGAMGYVTKSESTQRVVEAIRIVAGGGTFFPRPTTPVRTRGKPGDPGAGPGKGAKRPRRND